MQNNETVREEQQEQKMPLPVKKKIAVAAGTVVCVLLIIGLIIFYSLVASAYIFRESATTSMKFTGR